MLANQKGQAVIESVIAISSVLLVLVILLPLLGKFVETKQATEQAARYMAWERTVWFQNTPSSASGAAVKSNVELEREIHWRFFSSNQTKLSSDDSLQNKNWQVSRNLNPMLGTRLAHNNNRLISLMENNQNNNRDQLATASVSNNDSTGVGGAINDVLSLIDFGGFSVSTRGLYASNVQYDFAQLPGIEPFDQDLNINPTSELTLQGDGWNTAGKNHNKSLVKGLTPSSILDFGFMNTLQSGIGWLPFAKEIKPSSLRFGHVDTEQAPPQRICQLRGNRCRRIR